MVELELDLTQMNPLSLSVLLSISVSSRGGCCSLVAAGPEGRCTLRTPISETSTALPGTVWEPGRRQSLDGDRVGCKGCKTSTAYFLP